MGSRGKVCWGGGSVGRGSSYGTDCAEDTSKRWRWLPSHRGIVQIILYEPFLIPPLA